MRVGVVLGHVVGDAGLAAVHLGAAELFGGHHLADRRLHQRRTAEEDRALVLHDHRLVRHRRHIGAAGGAGAEHRRDLRNAHRRHLRLVVEDAAEVLAVREDLVLQRQERAAGIDQIDARQMVVARDLLRPQVLLHGDGIVGAALDGGVVGDDDAVAAADLADAGDDAAGRDLAVIHAVRRQRRQLQERAAGIEQRGDAVAHQELAALGVAHPRLVGAAARRLGELVAQILDRAAHGLGIAREVGGLGVDVRKQNGHPQPLSRQPLLKSSRPISMRRISEVPAPIS